MSESLVSWVYNFFFFRINMSSVTESCNVTLIHSAHIQISLIDESRWEKCNNLKVVWNTWFSWEKPIIRLCISKSKVKWNSLDKEWIFTESFGLWSIDKRFSSYWNTEKYWTCWCDCMKKKPSMLVIIAKKFRCLWTEYFSYGW